jgi:hypothetical protein
MNQPSSLRSELGLSSDQFYRRVRALLDAGMISAERGVKNQILLKDEHAAVLRQFRAIEQNSQERGLEWCIERLRFEIESERSAALAARTQTLEASLTFAQTEARQLRMALAKRTRNPFTRFFRAIAFRFSRKRPASA